LFCRNLNRLTLYLQVKGVKNSYQASFCHSEEKPCGIVAKCEQEDRLHPGKFSVAVSSW